MGWLDGEVASKTSFRAYHDYSCDLWCVPSAADVAAAIDGPEQLYTGCKATGKLAAPTFDFMKHRMAGSGFVQAVEHKVAVQPIHGNAGVVQNPGMFPTDAAPPNYFLQSSATVTPPQCPSNHPMPLRTYGSELGHTTAYLNGWTCDAGCPSKGLPTVPRHFCQICLIDLCVDCALRGTGPHSPAVPAHASAAPAPA